MYITHDFQCPAIIDMMQWMPTLNSCSPRWQRPVEKADYDQDGKVLEFKFDSDEELEIELKKQNYQGCLKQRTQKE